MFLLRTDMVGCASFLLASLNYLDFRGIFLDTQKAIFKYREEEATRGATLWGFPELFVGSARGGHWLSFFYVQNRGALLRWAMPPLYFWKKLTPRQPWKTMPHGGIVGGEGSILEECSSGF